VLESTQSAFKVRNIHYQPASFFGFLAVKNYFSSFKDVQMEQSSGTGLRIPPIPEVVKKALQVLPR